nr:hypothetical protein [Flavobacteriales bacterium]
MTPEQRFSIIVDEVLHYMWDPIGVAGTPEARDEYQGYVARVVELALANDEDGITAYLRTMETKHMGVAGDQRRCADVADAVMSWKLNLLGEKGEV